MLFDLDKTLIDEAYRLTPGWEDPLRDAIRETSELGWLVGLNSDTPQAQLRQWWSRLGMNGPIVAERGAVLDLPLVSSSGGQFTSLPTANSSIPFGEIRHRLANALLAQDGVLVVVGDATNVVGSVCPARRETHLDVVDDTLVVINQYSQFSLRFFVRVIDHSDDGRLRVEREATARIVSLVEDQLQNKPTLEMDPIEDTYGVVILRDQRSRKTGRPARPDRDRSSLRPPAPRRHRRRLPQRSHRILVGRRWQGRSNSGIPGCGERRRRVRRRRNRDGGTIHRRLCRSSSPPHTPIAPYSARTMSVNHRTPRWRLTVDDVHPRQAIWGFDLAPAGDALAFVLQRDERAQLSDQDGGRKRAIQRELVADLALLPSGGGYPVQLTSSGQVTGAPRWSPTSDRIAFQSGERLIVTSPYGEDETTIFEGTLYEPPLDTGDKWHGRVQWSPDGRALLFAVHERGRTALRVATADGRSAREVFSIEGFLLTWDWAPDGKRIVAVTRTFDGMSGTLQVVEFQTGEAVVLSEEADYEYQKPAAAWLPNGRILLRSNRSGWSKLWVLEEARRTPQAVTTGEHDEGAFRLSPTGRSLVCSSRPGPHGGGAALWIVPLDGTKPSLLTDQPGLNVPIAWARDDTVFYWHSSPTEPGDVWRTRAEHPALDPVRLTSSTPRALGRRLRAPDYMTVTSDDGTTVSAFVYLPAYFDHNETYPGIVWIHGGPTLEHRLDYEPAYTWLANEGFVVASPNYRGSTGFGVPHMSAVSGAGVGKNDLADVLATGRFLQTLPCVDSTRGVGVGGHSWGGYLALMAATQAPAEFSCVVASAAISDWEVQQGSTEVRYYDRWLLGGWVYDVKALARERSPILFVDAITAPMLVYHGEEDRDVPFEQARRFVDAARRAGKDVDHRFFSSEGHSNKLRENRQEVLEGTSRFFKHHLQRWNFVDNPCGEQIQYAE